MGKVHKNLEGEMYRFIRGSVASQKLRNTAQKETNSPIFFLWREVLQDLEKGTRSEIRVFYSKI